MSLGSDFVDINKYKYNDFYSASISQQYRDSMALSIVGKGIHYMTVGGCSDLGGRYNVKGVFLIFSER